MVVNVLVPNFYRICFELLLIGETFLSCHPDFVMQSFLSGLLTCPYIFTRNVSFRSGVLEITCQIYTLL